jgi:hypothetical protein
MDYSNLRRQAASMKKGLFDQACSQLSLNNISYFCSGSFQPFLVYVYAGSLPFLIPSSPFYIFHGSLE